MSDFKNFYIKRAGLRSQRNWANLPFVVLTEIYRLLSLNDRLIVSSTCKQWRDSFYSYPNWPDFDLSAFSLTSGDKNRKSQKFLRFVANCNTIKRLIVGFETFHLVGAALGSWYDQNVINISEVYFVSSSPVERSRFSELVYPFLRKFAQLKALFLFNFASLHELIEILFKHEKTLTRLGIGKLHPEPIKRRRDVSSALLWALRELRELRLLQIHAMWMTDEFLQGISDNLRNLKTLILFLDKSHPINKNVSEQSWEEFSQKLPDIEVRVTFFEMTDIAESDVPSYIPRCVQNITIIRMIECDVFFPRFVVDLAARLQLWKLHTIWKISSPKIEMWVSSNPPLPKGFPLPVKELVSVGYYYSMKHVLETVRRNPSLNLQIPLCSFAREFFRPESRLEQVDWFIEKMSELMGKKWEPMAPKLFYDRDVDYGHWNYMALRVALIDDLKLGFPDCITGPKKLRGTIYFNLL